jgi:hypothetical protein
MPQFASPITSHSAGLDELTLKIEPFKLFAPKRKKRIQHGRVAACENDDTITQYII